MNVNTRTRSLLALSAALVFAAMSCAEGTDPNDGAAPDGKDIADIADGDADVTDAEITPDLEVDAEADELTPDLDLVEADDGPSDTDLDLDTDVDGADDESDDDVEVDDDLDVPDDDSEPDEVDTDTDEIGPVCDREGFVPVIDFAEASEGFLFYEALDSVDDPYADLFMELLWDAADTGSFSFPDENYKTCETCLRLDADCTTATGCATKFLAYAGELEITAWGAVGTNLVATLRNVELREVTFDNPEDPFLSTPVPNGKVWCIDELAVDVLLEEM